MQLRNVAIIAHVDHGKTTLVDGLLKQAKTFRENEAVFGQTLIMDSNDQERERGITILAKTTAVQWGDTKINIIDTPGHADFAGEVERMVGMADAAILVVDAQEGPMPQTKFVLRKALELKLKPIVVINKIDKPDADIASTVDRVADLFLDLATEESQLEYPVFYAIGREGKSWNELPADPSAPADLTPIFEAILKYVPEPGGDPEGMLQLQVANLDYDTFQGRYAIGRIRRGTARPGMQVAVIASDGSVTQGKIEKTYVSQGLKRVEVDEAPAGEIVSLTGLKAAGIGDTVTDVREPEPMAPIVIEEPTLKMAVSANTSPFAGREGKFVTARHLEERIRKELETNVSMRMQPGGAAEFILSGRGELHLSVFIEALRREGFELQVSKPTVVTKEIEGTVHEPLEELTVDTEPQYVGAVTGEVGRRRGILLAQEDKADGSVRLIFEIVTRGLLGLRNQLLTLSRGTAIMHSLFLKFIPLGAPILRTRNGALIASETGKAVTNGLEVAQNRGITFIPPGTEVYEGMIIGMHTRENDLEINVAKEKKQTNIRSNADIAVVLSPPAIHSLEESLDFLEDDELLEVTPSSLRLRKRLLTQVERNRNKPR
jgi:GTP-binding protein